MQKTARSAVHSHHFENPLEFLLRRTPFRVAHVKVANVSNDIRVLAVHFQGLLEPFACLVDLARVTSHYAKSEVTCKTST